MNRSTAFRLPCLFTFLCISTTDLQSITFSKWISRRPHRRSDSRSQIPNRVKDSLIEFVQPFPLQSSVEYLTYVPAVPSEVNVVLVVDQSVLDRLKLAVFLCSAGEMYPNHSEEGTGGTESDLGRWNTARVLCDVQSLYEHI